MTKKRVGEEPSFPKSLFRRRVKKNRDEIRTAMEHHPRMVSFRKKRAQARQRFFGIVGVIVLALLLGFLRCSCEKPAETRPQGPISISKVKIEKPKQNLKPRETPDRSRVQKIDRNKFNVPEPDKVTWFEIFRQQVVARSPRLSACFERSSRPGGVRWSGIFNPSTGIVSDQNFEATGDSASITETQRECLAAVLSQPQFAAVVSTQNKGESENDVPNFPLHISMVLEF